MPDVRLYGHHNVYAVMDVLRLFHDNVREHTDTACDADHVVGSGEGTAFYSYLADGVVRTGRMDRTKPLFADVRGLVSPAGLDERMLKREVKRQLYQCLSKETGLKFPWGSLTGIRPTYVAGELSAELGPESAIDRLIDYYFVSPAKAELAIHCSREEQQLLDRFPKQAIALYVHIPFCPSRCRYCSFSTDDGIGRSEADLERYVDVLAEEFAAFARLYPQPLPPVAAVYVGGGTPTTLTAKQLDRLLDLIKGSGFTFLQGAEFTVEAGRPDTFSEDKLAALLAHGVGRVSLNTQTLNDSTLRRIGRAHTADDFYQAWDLVSGSGLLVNTDLIAGLDGETEADFRETVQRIEIIRPHSVTVHSLALKRSSAVQQELADTGRSAGRLYESGHAAGRMLQYAQDRFEAQGLVPYYLYRNKKGLGRLENVGYAPPGEGSLYNVAMMSNERTVLGFGAGSVSKWAGGSAKRQSNWRNLSQYMARPEEMAERKSVWLRDIAEDAAGGAHLLLE